MRADGGAELTGSVLCTLMRPIGKMTKYLTGPGKALFADVSTAALEFVSHQKLEELQSRDYEALSDVLKILKQLQPDTQTEAIDVHRMRIAEELLVSSTFNGKMNALKEIHQLCLDADDYHGKWLTHARVVDWIREKEVGYARRVYKFTLH